MKCGDDIVANPDLLQDDNIYVSTEELEAYFVVFCKKAEQYKTQNKLENALCFYSAYSCIDVISKGLYSFHYVIIEEEKSRNYHALLFDDENKYLHIITEQIKLSEQGEVEKTEKFASKIHYYNVAEVQFIADYKKRDVANIKTLTEIFSKERNYEKLETLRNLEIQIVTVNKEKHKIGFYENSGGDNSDTEIIQEKLQQMDKVLLKCKEILKK